MRISARLFRFTPDVLNQDDERQDLSKVLASAPGTTDVEIGVPHPKGGFRVTFEVAREALDLHIAHLAAHHWRLVL